MSAQPRYQSYEIIIGNHTRQSSELTEIACGLRSPSVRTPVANDNHFHVDCTWREATREATGRLHAKHRTQMQCSGVPRLTPCPSIKPDLKLTICRTPDLHRRPSLEEMEHGHGFACVANGRVEMIMREVDPKRWVTRAGDGWS